MNAQNSWWRSLFSKARGHQVAENKSRRTWGLTSLLLSVLFVDLLLTIINSAILPMYGVAIVSAVSGVLALLTLVYYKLTREYKVAAYLTIGIIAVCMMMYFHIVQNQHYAFIWIAIMPPIVYFLLDKRSGRVLKFLFGGYIAYFLLSGTSGWRPAEFSAQSIINIAAATLCIAGMLENLVRNRNEVMEELKEASTQLENQKSELRLILDSAAEAIYGVDLDGNCTFCNRRCIELLGYREPSDLLGKNMHLQIHHSKIDGTPFPATDCTIFKAILRHEGSHSEHEVFWRADHTSFAVEYYSYPQVKNGSIIGAVVTFTDITERRKKELEIAYLNCYDILTGLHNRRCFEESRDKIDCPENLPISIIFADINGLKMTNDIFGHTAGDKLIQKSSEILQQACREHDLVARVGGDEFIVLLPKTSPENAENIAARIRAGFLDAQVEAIKCSIALGLDTKHMPDQPLDEVLANAENAMYKDKTMNRKVNNKDIIDTIIETLHTRNSKEKEHSINVSELCLDLGIAMRLPETDISKLQRAGYLHDIGKIVLDEGILAKEKLTDEEMERMQQHSAIGYRILNLFDDTLDLAEYIYAHHEKWDGTGYPRGLQGEQIPLLSRIISVTEAYDRILYRSPGLLHDHKQHALDIISERSGTQFDPEVARMFIQMMMARNDSN